MPLKTKLSLKRKKAGRANGEENETVRHCRYNTEQTYVVQASYSN